LPISRLTLATRRSPLALRQAESVKDALEQRHAGLRVEILALGTTGDRLRDQPLPQIGGKGLFTKELEEALLEGRAHIAVHSLKDLPTELSSGLVLAAVPAREDARDVLMSRGGDTLAKLPAGARIGTSSVRRAAQLRRIRPDARIEPLRGNLGTRLRKLREGAFDAIVLAAAGLHRMGWKDQITEYLPEEVLCPAVGQGALAIEARQEDLQTLRLLAVLEDSWARFSATAERALLRRLGGGCQVPIAAFTARDGNDARLTALVIRPDGTELVRAAERGPVKDATAAAVLGEKAAESLLRQGAGGILESIAQTPTSLPTPQAP
jgi:hydroxymethylbilane synthase